MEGRRVGPEKNVRVILDVHVRPRARKREVRQTGERQFRVWVVAPPSKGEANSEVVEALAGHLKLPKSRLKILRGESSPFKRVEILPA